MDLTLTEIAELTGGSLKGDGSVRVRGAAGLAEAGPGDLSFLANKKYASLLSSSRAGAVIVAPGVDAGSRPTVVHPHPPLAWAKVLEVLDRERTRRPEGIHPTAVIAPSAKIGSGVVIGAHTVIEEGAVIGDRTLLYPQVYVGFGAVVGRDCLVYPRVTLRERVTVGDRCIFQPGVVIGADGFGFATAGGRHHKIPQVGTVEIGDDVEIQANTTIDRAAVGVTRIGRGTKIDNLVQIAHGVDIGSDVLVAALTGVAGSAKIGNQVTLAAQVGVVGHITVGDRLVVGARSGLTRDIKGDQVVWGTPAQPMRDELKTLAALRRLPELIDEVREMRKNKP